MIRALIELRRSDPWGVGPATPIETEAPDSVVAFARNGVARRGVVIANLGEREETVRLDVLRRDGSLSMRSSARRNPGSRVVP